LTRAIFGEQPTSDDYRQAAGLLWVAAGVAGAAVVVVGLLARRVRHRGDRLRGATGLAAWGAVAVVVLAASAGSVTGG